MSGPSTGPSYDFKKIYQASNKLVANNDSGMPPVQRGLDNLFKRTQSLKANAVAAESARDKGRILLSQNGIDIEKLNRTVNEIDLKPTYQPLEEIKTTDIASFLRHQHHMIIVSAIEEAKKDTIHQFERDYVNHLEATWEKERQDIRLRAGQQQWREGYDKNPLRAPPENTVHMQVLQTTNSRKQPSAMNRKMLRYASELSNLNKSGKNSATYNVVQQFKKIASSLEPSTQYQRHGDVVDCWELLRQCTAQGTIHMEPQQPQLLAGSRRFLEDQFLRVVTQYVDDVGKDKLERSGEPGTLSYVKSYLDLLNTKDPWAQVFFCIRAGDLKAAAEASKYENLDFHRYIEEYKNNKNSCPEPTRNAIAEMYAGLHARSKSVYQAAVYKIIGQLADQRQGSDHRDHLPINSLFQTIQDYMWHKLCMVSPIGQSNNAYTLEMLQDQVMSHGRQPDAPLKKNPLIYFQVLVMSQLFAQAVYFLMKVDLYAVEAVHFAIALDQYKLLKYPPGRDMQGADILFQTQDNTGRTRDFLNFTALIKSYVKSFAKSDVQDALQYHLIHDNPDVRFNCIKDLVIETGEFDLLLGSCSDDGTIQKGIIAQHNYTTEPDLLRVIDLAANTCETHYGEYEQAVSLFYLLAVSESIKAESEGSKEHAVRNVCEHVTVCGG
eukprot:GFYU01029826.1.p1 GENE.GFYU01029826.1~~GFYU01029826.1.p1  ORF type:complete len:663 (-),score=185.63 GFYU01029826.1:114-2102(-)